MLKINTEKNINLSIMFIIVVVVMYILSRINLDKFMDLFVIQSLQFTHVFPWRFITYCFYFGDSPFFFVFTVLILFLFAVNLERIWGSFYFGLFLLVTIVSQSIACFIFGATLPIVDRMTLYTSLMIAFGFNFPDEKVYLFFVLPIRIKILAIIALVIMGFSLLNSLLTPFMILFLEQNIEVLPREYATILEEYNTLKGFFNYGLISISPSIAPFIVKVFSYLSLIIFYPKVFGLSNNRELFKQRIEMLKRRKEELLRQLEEQSVENKNKTFSKELNEGINVNITIDSEDDGVLCSEDDFDEKDDYCLKCKSFKRCVIRAKGENNIVT